MWVSLLSMLKV